METYIRQADLEAIEMEGSWVILNPNDYTVTKLNALGSVCWELLTKEQSVQSLTEQIQKDFEVSSEIVQNDITQFLGELMDAGLITK
ncbi:PqqD family protein [Bacillus sp. es.036]|uniref:PqqD family protein n=1 Tax=Bacillus sp. es.036 TaxID=1761764 RepID=UPI000BF9D9B6|nr:PqqD family protein [Bacillus sp. es.036]PFG15026.1 coenzyme PQQ synthesis protein D (PqqD) [Bacillus sp. es.036]